MKGVIWANIKVFVVVIDSMGIGDLGPDRERILMMSAQDTLGHISDALGGTFLIPNMAEAGHRNIETFLRQPGGNPIAITDGQKKPRQRILMTGCWEMMGLYDQAVHYITEHGFPKELLDELSARCREEIVGNRSESGTKIIERSSAKKGRIYAITR